MGIKKSLLKSWNKPTALTGVLRPLSVLYKGAFALRKAAFNHGLFERYQAPVPVIVVGNLTVGGTGKTPLVVHLVEQLKLQGFTPGVISRGYSGAADGYPLLVTANTAVEHSGDEPALIMRRTGVPMAVGPNRRASIELLLKHYKIDLIISDDGLQHLALKRDLEICLIDQTTEHENENLLPAGPYREPLSRLLSVDFIVRHGGEVGNAENQFSMNLEPANPLPVVPSNKSQFPENADFHAIAGIAKPQRFFETCERLGFTITAHSFADHYLFRSEDISFDDRPVLMTEKDAVKCLEIASENHWYLPVDAMLSAGFAEAVAITVRKKFSNREENG
ncbi:MAG: tetraacyldisaccharide 4'-kinase [Arenicella sp.]|jgi:tetraacyldisaccharide 4'-kinase